MSNTSKSTSSSRRPLLAYQPRVALSSLVLGVLASACGGRHELGEVMQNLADSPVRDARQLGILIVDGVEDADIEVESGRIGPSIGDIDGDGHGDSSIDDASFSYGGPRPSDGLFAPAVSGRFDGSIGIGGREAFAAGDIDGDGLGDVFRNSFHFSQREFGDESGYADFKESHWPAQHALLTYGSRDRSSITRASAAKLRDPEPKAFPAFPIELALELEPRAAGYQAAQDLTLQPLGDIDADGYDDFALSIVFKFTPSIIEQHDDGDVATPSNERMDAETYIFYGSPQRYDTAGAGPPPAARLPDIRWVTHLGDVDGDRFDDFATVSADDYTIHIVAGHAERLTGDVLLAGAPTIEGVTNFPSVASLGDLDNDGYEDFTISQYLPESSTTHLFYGGQARTTQTLHVDFAHASFHMTSLTPLILMPLGDWNGDGLNDLLLSNYHDPSLAPLPSSSPFPDTRSTGEARVITGRSERYSGRHVVEFIQPVEPESPRVSDFQPVGDVDGDGFADISFKSRDATLLKYGGPLVHHIR